MSLRILITGGAGFLGQHLLRRSSYFTTSATLHVNPAVSIPGIQYHVCDLRNPEQVRILLDRVRPAVLIHTACSDQGNDLEAIPITAALLGMETSQRNIRFIHLSTDHVFDGAQAPYGESDALGPLTEYGKAKAHAEDLLQTINPNVTIVRTSILYDLDSPDRTYRRILEAEEKGEPIRLFTDEIRSPVWVKNLADALLELATLDFSGHLHLGGPEPLSRWDIGMNLLEHYGIRPTTKILGETVEESGMVRPKNLTLNSEKAQDLLTTPLLTFKNACQQAKHATS